MLHATAVVYIKTAERAVQIMPNLKEYCSAAQLKKVTCPMNHSFSVVQKGVKDPLMIAKLEFFLMVAREVEPVLTPY